MANDACSIKSLLRDAIAEAMREEEDDDAYWELIHALQKRDVREVWELLEPLATDLDPRLRSLVPDVLRFLGGTTRPVADQTIALLRGMLANESSPNVLAAIGYALGEIGLPASVELMTPFAGHLDVRVRRGVVSALLGQPDPLAIRTLIELSRDEDDDTRDWATFGLGSQLGSPDDEALVDTEELRDALAARLDDPHRDTKYEAMVGLAMRRDSRVVPILRRELENGPAASLVLEAVRWMATPELCMRLRALAESDDVESVKFWMENGLKEAIAACCGREEDARKQ